MDVLTPDPADDLRAEIKALEAEVADLVRQSAERDQIFPTVQDRLQNLPYSQTEHRFLTTRGPYLTLASDHLRYFWHNHALAASLFGAAAPVELPPRILPPAIREGLSMSGSVPLIEAYMAMPAPAPLDPALVEAELDEFLERLEALRAPLKKELDRRWRATMHRARAQFMVLEDRVMGRAAATHVQAGTSVAVIGRVAPLYEAYCLHQGARPVTIDLAGGGADSRRINRTSLDELEAVGRRFDCALASPMVARLGLGLIGPGLDPDADLRLMARLGRLLAPSGLLLLSVPTGSDLVLFNLSRVYGPLRLPLLLRGWDCVDRMDGQPTPERVDEPMLSTFVLRSRPEWTR
jgi:hypothetical protein